MTRKNDRNRKSASSTASPRKDRGCVRGCKGSPRKVLEALLARGWVVVRSKRHIILAHNDYAQHITLPRTSSDHRAARQSLCMLRRHFGLDLRPAL